MHKNLLKNSTLINSALILQEFISLIFFLKKKTKLYISIKLKLSKNKAFLNFIYLICTGKNLNNNIKNIGSV